MKRFLFLAVLIANVIFCMAQSDRQYVRNGNKWYRQQNFIKAEAEYRKSLAVNPNNPQALYNLGCALLMQKKDSAAVKQFEMAGQYEKNPLRRAKIYHNIGFVCQSNKLYGDAIKAYKESLRNNPSDNETRYNMVLCMRQNKSKNNSQKKNQQKQNNENKKDQEKRQNNRDKNKQKQKDQQSQNDQMSKDNAEQLLNAAMQDEQATQRRVKDAMRQNHQRRLEKNW